MHDVDRSVEVAAQADAGRDPEREWGARFKAFLTKFTAELTAEESQGRGATESQVLTRCASRYEAEVGAPPTGPLEPVHALAQEMMRRFEAEARGELDVAGGGTSMIQDVLDALSTASAELWGVSFKSGARMRGPGLGPGVPIGILRLENQRLMFTDKNGDGFDFGVAQLRNVRTPWWKLGTGFSFDVGSASYSCTFNQMAGNDRNPKQMTQAWRKEIERAVTAQSSRTPGPRR